MAQGVRRVIRFALAAHLAQVSLVKPGSPFQIAINYESKRKTPSLVGFYKVRTLPRVAADATRVTCRACGVPT